MVETMGLIAAVAMPLWNIPLMLRIQRRRSSQDLSVVWVLGIWACILLMLPAGLRSSDPILRVFTLMNLLSFTGVVVQVVRFRSSRCS